MVQLNKTELVRLADTLVGSHYLTGAGGGTPELPPGIGALGTSLSGLGSRGAGRVEFSETLDLVHSRHRSSYVVGAAKTRFSARYCAGRCNVIPTRFDAEAIRHWADGKTRFEMISAQYTPRYVGGSSGDSSGGGGGAIRCQHYHGIVMGENCIGKRHFDCVWFVNYCMSETIGRVISYNPEQYTTHYRRGVERYDLYSLGISGYIQGFPPDGPQDGDIVVRLNALIPTRSESEATALSATPDHIGLLGADGAIYQAQTSTLGVTKDCRFGDRVDGHTTPHAGGRRPRFTHLIRFTTHEF